MDDGTDKFSSIVDVPSCLKREYDSLVPIAREHSVKFPASGEYESNSGALINALKALQERIRLLELDKNVTLKRLDHLKEEYQPFSVKDMRSYSSDHEMKVTSDDNKDEHIHRESKAVQVSPSEPTNDPASHKSITSRSAGVRRDKKSPGNFGCHYHLNFKDVPFLVGMSTTPSHSVFANYQHILSLMKSHSCLCKSSLKQVDKISVFNHLLRRSNRLSEELIPLLFSLEKELETLKSEKESLKIILKKSEDLVQIRETKLRLRIIHFFVQALSEEIVNIREQISVMKKDDFQQKSCGNKIKNMDSPKHLLQRMKQVQKTLQSDDLNWL